MGRRRDEIVADILKVALDGARKTHIMYKCNLSYKLLDVYLKTVLKAELVFCDRCRNCYITTQKGKLFLEKFGSYMAHSKKVESDVSEVNRERESLERML